MQTVAAQLTLSATIGAALVLPFVLLELANRNLTGNLPVPLFGLMWILSTATTSILASLVRSFRTRDNVMARPVSVLLRVVCLIPFAWFLVVLVLDQLPCFLGTPNCD